MARPDACEVRGDRRVRPAPIPGRGKADRTFTPEEAAAEASRCAAAGPCLYCDVCQLLCPDLAITRDPETGLVVIDLDYCKGCGLCAHYCPRGAIEMIVDG